MLAGFVSTGVISATFFNLAVTVIGQRENGILKRRDPGAVFLSGNVLIVEQRPWCCASSAPRSRSSTSTTRS